MPWLLLSPQRQPERGNICRRINQQSYQEQFESLSPTPGELFAPLGKAGKINWAAQYRAPIPTTYGNRAQIALNLGGLIADGFIAVEAKDSQQVKNIGSDIIKLQRRSELASACLAAAIALTNSLRTTSGTRSRKNWKRRKTR